jgi:hypothetical protein
MSKFKPDIFKNLQDKGFASTNTVESIAVQVLAEEKLADVKKLVSALEEYGECLKGLDKTLFTYSKLAIATTKNIYDPIHLLSIFLDFWYQTSVKTNPELDAKQIKDVLDTTQKKLKELVRSKELIDNELITSILIGFLTKLL